jgi:2-polyprenyl-6-methoxyphenol hydroxylase-like FAD-dependent oxidoreductase
MNLLDDFVRTAYAKPYAEDGCAHFRGQHRRASLAYWLSEYGFTTTVVERAPALRAGGQTVDPRGAGRTVIERMKLMDRVRKVSLDQRGIAFVGADGRIRARMPTALFGGEGIVSDIEVLRGDLARVLYEATVPGTEYLFDDTARRLDQDDEGVTVTFEKAPPRRFSLVIGADGLNSAIRGLAFGPRAQYVRPLGCYTAWFTAAAEFDLGGWFLMHNAPGGLVASIRPGRVPGETKAGLYFRSAPIDYDPRDTARQMDILASRFSRARWEVPQLLKAMRAAPDFFFDSISQVRLDRWSSHRTALVGDAAYCPTPLTGLGTSLALAGAYVLAGELQEPSASRTFTPGHSAWALWALTRCARRLPASEEPQRNSGLYAAARWRSIATRPSTAAMTRRPEASQSALTGR